MFVQTLKRSYFESGKSVLVETIAAPDLCLQIEVEVLNIDCDFSVWMIIRNLFQLYTSEVVKTLVAQSITVP